MRVIGGMLMVMAMAAMAMADGDEESDKQGVCRSVGGLKFDANRKPMQHSKGMDVCSQYRQSSCCNETHMMPLRLKIREPAVAQFNLRCQRITEKLVCSSCHPLVGTGLIKTICPQLCEDWYQACRFEFYAYGSAGRLTPCYGNALVCSPLSAIESTGADFCSRMGYLVGSEDDVNGVDCFDASVPPLVGEPEPVESWQDWLRRLYTEQSEDPSGLGTMVILLPLLLVLGYRLLFSGRQRDSLQGCPLTLEEVRALQQAAYGVDEGDNGDSDSDFSDDDGIRERASSEPQPTSDEITESSELQSACNEAAVSPSTSDVPSTTSPDA